MDVAVCYRAVKSNSSPFFYINNKRFLSAIVLKAVIYWWPQVGGWRCRECGLTPVLRSGTPGGATFSAVVLSPTMDGNVCDIQFVIIAMVLKTTPIFSSGTDMVYFLLDSRFTHLHSSHCDRKITGQPMLPIKVWSNICGPLPHNNTLSISEHGPCPGG